MREISRERSRKRERGERELDLSYLPHKSSPLRLSESINGVFGADLRLKPLVSIGMKHDRVKILWQRVYERLKTLIESLPLV